MAINLTYATIKCPACRTENIGTGNIFDILHTTDNIYKLKCNNCDCIFNVTPIEDHWS